MWRKPKAQLYLRFRMSDGKQSPYCPARSPMRLLITVWRCLNGIAGQSRIGARSGIPLTQNTRQHPRTTAFTSTLLGFLLSRPLKLLLSASQTMNSRFTPTSGLNHFHYKIA